MQVKVIIFGQLTDLMGRSEIVLNDTPDTDTLVGRLQGLYPALEDSKFVIAVERKIINSNTLLQEGNTVALLPPFSGG